VALACLTAARRPEASRTQPSGWSGYFRATGRKDAGLDPEQVAREGEAVLREFPVLRSYLQAMAAPVLGPDDATTKTEEEEEARGGLGAALCGKPLVSLLLGGPQGPGAQAVALEAFRQALASRDLGRALSLLELYGGGAGGGHQEGELRDHLLACAALEGEEVAGHTGGPWGVNMLTHTAGALRGVTGPGCWGWGYCCWGWGCWGWGCCCWGWGCCGDYMIFKPLRVTDPWATVLLPDEKCGHHRSRIKFTQI